MEEVKWLPEAIQDIERLHSFLYEKSPEAAAKMAILIINAAAALQTNPRIGRIMPDQTERREFFALYGAGAYVLRYKLVNKVPIIIRVWHSREYRST